MKYYIIAGEASGDLHGSNLITALKKLDSQAAIRCWGGDKMEAAGAVLVKHYRELAFMGFSEVLMNLRTIFRNLAFCKEDILAYRPDAIILVDYPGFNLRIAQWAHAQGLKVIYYISPQVWAWKENRVKMMKQCIDKMLVILPFEKEYFKERWDWEVEYVGHPLVDVIDQFREEAERKRKDVHYKPTQTEYLLSAQQDPIIALLPGSRKQEILKKLPVMLEVSKAFPNYHFIVAKAPGVDDSFYDAMLKDMSNVSYISNRTYDILLNARAALVTSGTATLETALFGVPEAVCYKGSYLSYQIGRRLVKVKYISLVNLIMNKLVVKEFIQDEMTPENLQKELQLLLTDGNRIAALKNDYAALKTLLGKEGNASGKAARSIYQFLTQ